jgi:hypothetical protein
MALGKKLSKSISSLGKKASGGISQLGRKVTEAERNIQKGISKGIDLGQGAIRQTERGIEQVSGKVGAIKQGLNVGARVIDALQATGVAGAVPGLAPTLGAVSSGLKAGAGGLQRLQDVGAEKRMALGKRSNQLGGLGERAQSRVGGVAEKSRAKLERVGERAKALEAKAQEDISNVSSAFSS